MSEEKPIPPVELSAKYMAWDIKNMTKAVQDLLEVMRSIDVTLKSIARPKSSSSPVQERGHELPF